jgi:hypothetical protein
MRSSQPGSHQFASPRSSIVDGTMTSRMRVASMKIALASPMPNNLMMFLAEQGVAQDGLAQDGLEQESASTQTPSMACNRPVPIASQNAL